MTPQGENSMPDSHVTVRKKCTKFILNGIKLPSDYMYKVYIK